MLYRFYRNESSGAGIGRRSDASRCRSTEAGLQSGTRASGTTVDGLPRIEEIESGSAVFDAQGHDQGRHLHVGDLGENELYPSRPIGGEDDVESSGHHEIVGYIMMSLTRASRRQCSQVRINMPYESNVDNNIESKDYPFK